MSPKFLVLGHPRCGTGYMAQLFQAFGYDVRHEKVGKDGISCWAWATFDPNPPWSPGSRALWEGSLDPDDTVHVIHVVRDPLAALSSIAFADSDELSARFRDRYGIQLVTGPILNAALSYMSWNKLIEAQEWHFRVPVETAAEQLPTFLTENGLEAERVKPLPPTDYNTRPHPKPGPQHLREAMTDPVWEALMQLREHYGYGAEP